MPRRAPSKKKTGGQKADNAESTENLQLAVETSTNANTSQGTLASSPTLLSGSSDGVSSANVHSQRQNELSRRKSPVETTLETRRVSVPNHSAFVFQNPSVKVIVTFNFN
jgi:hypothetical protein